MHTRDIKHIWMIWKILYKSLYEPLPFNGHKIDKEQFISNILTLKLVTSIMKFNEI